MEISEEEKEEKLLILKKRWTGHMRLIVEIFQQDLVKEKIMHECISNLISAVDDVKKVFLLFLI